MARMPSVKLGRRRQQRARRRRGRGQPALRTQPRPPPVDAADQNRGMVQGSARALIATGRPIGHSSGRAGTEAVAASGGISRRQAVETGRCGSASPTDYTEGSTRAQPGQEIVSNVLTGLEPAQRPGQQGAGQSQSPLIPQRGTPGGGGRGR